MFVQFQEKLVIIPEARKEKDFSQSVPTFVRNVMGSSAGAGSGEFHVYRHLRRKEYARQKNIKMKSEKERMDDEFQNRLEDNQKKADDKTSKKRAKRQKRKMKMKGVKKPKTEEKEDSNSEDDSDNEEETEANSNTESSDIVEPKEKVDERETIVEGLLDSSAVVPVSAEEKPSIESK